VTNTSTCCWRRSSTCLCCYCTVS